METEGSQSAGSMARMWVSSCTAVGVKLPQDPAHSLPSNPMATHATPRAQIISVQLSARHQHARQSCSSDGGWHWCLRQPQADDNLTPCGRHGYAETMGAIRREDTRCLHSTLPLQTPHATHTNCDVRHQAEATLWDRQVGDIVG
jgi:hypothetical protein